MAAAEQIIEDFPAFKEAGKHAIDLAAVSEKVELEAWLESFQDWTARARDLTFFIDNGWFTAAPSFRHKTADMIGDWLNQGAAGNRGVK